MGGYSTHFTCETERANEMQGSRDMMPMIETKTTTKFFDSHQKIIQQPNPPSTLGSHAPSNMRQRSVFDNLNPFMKGTAVASMNNSQRQSALTSSLGQAGANISRTGGATMAAT